MWYEREFMFFFSPPKMETVGVWPISGRQYFVFYQYLVLLLPWQEGYSVMWHWKQLNMLYSTLPTLQYLTSTWYPHIGTTHQCCCSAENCPPLKHPPSGCLLMDTGPINWKWPCRSALMLPGNRCTLCPGSAAPVARGLIHYDTMSITLEVEYEYERFLNGLKKVHKGEHTGSARGHCVDTFSHTRTHTHTKRSACHLFL